MTVSDRRREISDLLLQKGKVKGRGPGAKVSGEYGDHPKRSVGAGSPGFIKKKRFCGSAGGDQCQCIFPEIGKIHRDEEEDSKRSCPADPFSQCDLYRCGQYELPAGPPADHAKGYHCSYEFHTDRGTDERQ